jgi:hypothetical protein
MAAKKSPIVIEKAELALFIQNLCRSAWLMADAFGIVRAQQLDLLPEALVTPQNVAEAMAILGQEETRKLMQLIDNFEKTVGLDATDAVRPFEYKHADYECGADVKP